MCILQNIAAAFFGGLMYFIWSDTARMLYDQYKQKKARKHKKIPRAYFTTNKNLKK
jgi:hypothetical protein